MNNFGKFHFTLLAIIFVMTIFLFFYFSNENGITGSSVRNDESFNYEADSVFSYYNFFGMFFIIFSLILLGLYFLKKLK